MIPPRVKDPNLYGLDIKSSVKARKIMLKRCVASCGENLEICGPQMNNTWDLINENWRVVQWFKSLSETSMTGFSHLALHV